MIFTDPGAFLCTQFLIALQKSTTYSLRISLDPPLMTGHIGSEVLTPNLFFASTRTSYGPFRLVLVTVKLYRPRLVEGISFEDVHTTFADEYKSEYDHSET